MKKQRQGVTPFKAINYILALKRLSTDPEDLIKQDTDGEYQFVKKISVDYNSRGKCCDTYLVRSASDHNLEFVAQAFILSAAIRSKSHDHKANFLETVF